VAVALGLGAGDAAVAQDGEGSDESGAADSSRVTVTLLPELTSGMDNVRDVNDEGQAVGLTFEGMTPTSSRHALLWDGQAIIDLAPDFPPVDARWVTGAGMYVNNQGQAAGQSLAIGGSEGDWGEVWLWENGQREVIGAFPGGTPRLSRIEPVDLNERGDVLWSCPHDDPAIEDLHVCVFSDGASVAAPDVGGQLFTGVDINNLGVVAGNAGGEPYVWAVGQEPEPLALPEGSTGARARFINDAGDVAGVADYPDGEATVQRVVRWRDGQPTDLGTLGGDSSELPWTLANDSALNESGDIVGRSTTRNGDLRGFVWMNGRMIDLGEIERYGSLHLNNARQVVVGGDFFWQRGRRLALTRFVQREVDEDASVWAWRLNNSGQVFVTVTGDDYRTLGTINVPVR
jgi:probable HAF family extracellular repeat protein